MVIKVNNADFSACGLGKCPMYVSQEAKEFCQKYTRFSSDRVDVQEAVQLFLEGLDYMNPNGFYSSIKFLALPLLSSTVHEAITCPITGYCLTDPDANYDIANIYSIENGTLEKEEALIKSTLGVDDVPLNYASKFRSNTIPSIHTIIGVLKGALRPQASWYFSLPNASGGISNNNSSVVPINVYPQATLIDGSVATSHLDVTAATIHKNNDNTKNLINCYTNDKHINFEQPSSATNWDEVGALLCGFGDSGTDASCNAYCISSSVLTEEELVHIHNVFRDFLYNIIAISE